MDSPPRYIVKRIQKAQEQQLKALDLSQDWHTNDNLRLVRIPDEVFELRQLKVLNLSHNALSFIPASISQLHRLKHLIVFRNKITDIPKGILQLHDLVSLDVSSNPLRIFRRGYQTCQI
jgi:internalin A